MTARIDLALDCTDPQLLAGFWKTALGYVDGPPDDGAWLWLCDPDGVGPRFCLVEVPEPKTVKNRFHIDIRVPGHGGPGERWARIKAESERLVRAGGSVLQVFEGRHVVLADPEGNELCVGT